MMLLLLPEEYWQMPHPTAEVFWQIPHRWDRQDHKYPINGTTTTIIIKFINEMASTRKWHFRFRKLPSLRLFCYDHFSNKRIKSRMAFQQLAGVALRCEQRLHFRCVSWRAKVSHDSSNSKNVASARRVELHLQLLVLKRFSDWHFTIYSLTVIKYL